MKPLQSLRITIFTLLLTTPSQYLRGMVHVAEAPQEAHHDKTSEHAPGTPETHGSTGKGPSTAYLADASAKAHVAETTRQIQEGIHSQNESIHNTAVSQEANHSLDMNNHATANPLHNDSTGLELSPVQEKTSSNNDVSSQPSQSKSNALDLSNSIMNTSKPSSTQHEQSLAQATPRTSLQIASDTLNNVASSIFGSGKTHQTITNTDGTTYVQKTYETKKNGVTNKHIEKPTADGKTITQSFSDKGDLLATKTVKSDYSYKIVNSEGRLVEANGNTYQKPSYDKNTGTTTTNILSDGRSIGKLIQYDPQVSVSDVYDNQGRKIEGLKQEITINKAESKKTFGSDMTTSTEIMTKIYRENNLNEPIATKIVTNNKDTYTTTRRGETRYSTVNEINHRTTNTINYYDATGKLISNGTQLEQAYFGKENKSLVIDTNTTNQSTNTVPTTLKPVDISKITSNKGETPLAKSLRELKKPATT